MFDPGKPGDKVPARFPARRSGDVRLRGRKESLDIHARRLLDGFRTLSRRGWATGRLIYDISRRFVLSLSGQLAIMTAVFVTIVEIMILIPSLASDQEEWLINAVQKAEIASQAVDTASQMAVSEEQSDQLRRSANVLYLAVRINGETLRLFDSNVVVPEEVLDLGQSHRNMLSDVAYLWAPWQTLLSPTDRLIHIQAKPRVRAGEMIEIVVRGEPLKKHLQTSLLNMLRMSFGIALAAGILIFAALSFVIVRPIRKLTDAIQRFKTNPEDVAATPELSGRADEIGDIEHELVAMQEEVRNSLRSRARLAALGQAVSKINHDLRNMLTSAQMASDRLATSGDPTVAKALPRLERALDRALSLATNVLTYGKSDERAPQVQIIKLKELTEAAAEDAGLCLPGQSGEDGVRFSLKAPKGFNFEADPEQMHRLLVNLMRNARQAIELQPNRRTRGRVSVTAIKTVEDIILIVADNGPGIPEKARDKLFQPFTSSSTPGGSGLGLAISRELAQLHGGDVRLVNTGAEGTSFEVRLPLKG